IMDALKERPFDLGEPVTLFHGFREQVFEYTLSDYVKAAGMSVPMVMLVGARTGRIYYFALKALLPDKDI
ncbi:MAG: hypothetical protein ACRDL7_09740, partial [Gaiellaceae bacterium]